MIAAAPALRRAGLLGGRAVWRAAAAQRAYIRRPMNEGEALRLSAVLLSIVQGWDANEVRGAVSDAAPRLVQRAAHRCARSVVDRHLDAGEVVVIASSAPVDLVVPIAREFGAHAVTATSARLAGDGTYSGEMATLCHGPAKALGVRALAAQIGLDLAISTAYSDAVSDLPLLGSVGTPVATNPERALAVVARERGWRMLSLR